MVALTHNPCTWLKLEEQGVLCQAGIHYELKVSLGESETLGQKINKSRLKNIWEQLPDSWLFHPGTGIVEVVRPQAVNHSNKSYTCQFSSSREC